MMGEDVKTIVFIAPYFGKLPDTFELYLLSCRYNPTIDWIILTDDRTEYDYPPNVKVYYCKLSDFNSYIQSKYDFKICLERAYKLCDFKPAYGDIFQDYISGYDFWGHCDLDLIWGNIRRFMTDDILSSYDKIGYQGHCTLYRNTEENNQVYKIITENSISYKKVYSSPQNFYFDEDIMTNKFAALGKKQYMKTFFAHPSALHYNLYLKYLPEIEDFKNKHQIMEWNAGTLTRVYYYENKIGVDEFMYFHIFQRKVRVCNTNREHFLISHHRISDPVTLNKQYLVSHNRNNMVLYYIELIYRKRGKISIHNIINSLKARKDGIEQLKRRN